MKYEKNIIELKNKYLVAASSQIVGWHSAWLCDPAADMQEQIWAVMKHVLVTADDQTSIGLKGKISDLKKTLKFTIL